MLINKIVVARTGPERMANPKTPSDYGMEFKSVDIMSSDGVRLSAWEIAAPGDSNKLAIVNHPLTCTRYGVVKGLDGVSVEFLPMVRHLYDNGFNVLFYEHRGQGESDGGLGATVIGREAPVGCGALEWQDFAGALQYVKKHPSFSGHRIAIMSQCMGANAAMAAWGLAPEAFEGLDIRCHVALQPTISYNMMVRMTTLKLGQSIADEVVEAQRVKYNIPFANPFDTIQSIKVPMLFAQVKQDQYTLDASGINDVQAIYDACPTEKQLIWIGPDQPQPYGTGKRFEGYRYFNDHPKELLAFLQKHTN